MERRLIAVLSVSLIGALMVIAFQAGKLSVKTSDVTPKTGSPTATERPVEKPRPEETLPFSASVPLQPVERSAQAVKEQLTLPPQITLGAPQPDAPPSVQRQERGDAPRRPADTGSAAAITAYFARIDAIHVEGTGDPTTFAQGILGGIQSGDSSQMDKLVTDAKLALGQAARVQPPAACAEYHRRLIDALSESVAGLEKFRNAVQTSDLTAITSVAAQLQSAQKKINDLELMRKQLLVQ